LREGQSLRMEMTGYPYVYKTLRITRVDDEVIGPTEVRRFLGPEIADSIPLSGPVVVVHAALADDAFISGGESFRYFDGMHATARAQLRSQNLLLTLIPAIRVVTEQRQ